MTLASLKQTIKPFAHRIAALVTRQKAQLTPEKMLEAYRKGYFPWPGRLGLIIWQDPEQRAVLPLDERFHPGKRLSRMVRSGRFEVTFDRAFREVLAGCAETREGREWTWLTPELIEAYTRLYERGYAHSVEAWYDGQLAGGGFGVAIGGFYSSESMFTRVDHASKVALVHLIERLREHGFSLCDSQILSHHTAQFGGFNMPRHEYKTLLADALKRDVRF